MRKLIGIVVLITIGFYGGIYAGAKREKRKKYLVSKTRQLGTDLFETLYVKVSPNFEIMLVEDQDNATLLDPALAWLVKAELEKTLADGEEISIMKDGIFKIHST